MTFMSRWLKYIMNKYETFLQKIHQPPNILSYWLSNFINEPWYVVEDETLYLMVFLLHIFIKSIFLTKHTLEIRSCTGDSGLSLPDATMHPVKSTTDVLNLMKLGEVNRVVSSTAINNSSSRSHRLVFRSWFGIYLNLVVIGERNPFFFSQLDYTVFEVCQVWKL